MNHAIRILNMQQRKRSISDPYQIQTTNRLPLFPTPVSRKLQKKQPHYG